MRRRTLALLAACAAAPLALVALPAQAVTTFSQNAFSVSVSGSSASLVANIGANPTTTVNDAKFCTRDSGGTVVDYTAPNGDDTIPSTGVTIRRTTVALSAGDYTSVPCVRIATTGSYTEVGARKPFTVAGSTPSPSPTPTPTVTPTPPPPTTSPTATPTPTPATTTPPPAAGFPDASSAGVPAGTTLKRVPQDVTSGTGWHFDTRGWVSIDDPGAVFSGFQTAYNVNVFATGATISNNLITSNGPDYNISLRHASGATIDHNTIRGTSSQPCDNGIRGMYGDDDDITITANDISFCASGINHFDRGGLIRDNYIHDLGHPCTTGDVDCGHFNGIQLGSGEGPLMTIDHNTIFNPAPATDCIMLANDDGAQANRTITNNLLGGAGYTFYGSGWEGAPATGIKFIGNQFSTRFFPQSGSLGPATHWSGASTNVWSGNTWADGPNAGQTVNHP